MIDLKLNNLAIGLPCLIAKTGHATKSNMFVIVMRSLLSVMRVPMNDESMAGSFFSHDRTIVESVPKYAEQASR